MAKASERTANDFVKLIYVGASGTGKTGSLVSLVESGYQLRIIDMDNGLDSLIAFASHKDKAFLDQIDYQTFRDKFKSDPIQGAIVDGRPKAYVDAITAMNKWDDGTVPSQWGDNTIFVLDSLTAFGRAAFHWAKGMNPGAKDPRQWYGAAQESIKTVLELLTSEAFRAHVIIITHVDLVEMPDGLTKGFASSIGKALGPTVPKYFNTMILAESKGSGENVKRTITTLPNGFIDLKSPKPFDMPKSLPLETGMATIFKTLRV